MKLINFFDKLEDRARARLSQMPVVYAFIGGVGIVLFWHAITEMAIAIPFMNNFNGLPWLVVSLVLLLTSGIFVSYFVGDQLIMSGLKGEKKIIEKTKDEIIAEEAKIKTVINRLEKIEQKLDEIASLGKE